MTPLATPMGEASWVPTPDGEEILHLGHGQEDLALSDWIEMNGGWADLDDDEDAADIGGTARGG